MSTVTAQLLAGLLNQHGSRLELLARQWCNSPADVVQDALVELAAQPAVPENLLGWLYRVVRNRAIDASRRDQRRRRHETAAGGLGRAWFEPATDSRLDAAVVGECLARLPPDERDVVTLHLWSGLSFEEIAQVVGLSSSTVHRRYHAGLATLRQALEVSCPTTKKTLRT